ncbi:MAG: hypothetical protein A3F84_29470 [Candidatus Handelsmanbacteria bacterium RIFCSPLOWO2_12_FULL_64_10]|uniref:Vitamin K epoxide reductase domain-containing protein n=1 Tax=Handelsmanbacteria sp. (strain RIFCSPLOWO2_12_FULL_64_10) TaxID=1817868 RepID=A0A1F6CBW4_HANXR|nr:MAG: hypothetical protein A3F84_29470 [Candidatus Handelsmanbacteria bacterium RIFCSPLOWO2_12_FULL_64_10]
MPNIDPSHFGPPAAHRRRRFILATAAGAAAGSTAAAVAQATATWCGGCSIAHPWSFSIAVAAAAAWAAVAFFVHRSWTEPSQAPARPLAMAALLLAGCHLAIVLERPGEACVFCLVAALCGILTATSLARACVRPSRSPLLASTFVGLLLGVLVAPAMAVDVARSATAAQALPSTLADAPVVSILSPRCPVCIEFLQRAVPELRRLLGDRYAVYWYFQIDDADAYDLVRRRLPDASDTQIERQLAIAIELLRRSGVRHVPVTFVGAHLSDPTALVGPYSPHEILAAAGGRIDFSPQP